MQQALGHQAPNVDDIMQRIRAELAADFQTQLASERAAHQKALAAAQDKHSRLLSQLQTEQINYRNLENSMTEGELKLKKKMNALEHSLEQLSILYSQLTSQKAKMNVEMMVQDKKIKRKQDEVAKLQGEITNLRKEIVDMKNREALEQRKPVWRGVFTPHRIKKAIKGGRHIESLSPIHSPLPEIPEFKQRREEAEEERKD